MQVESLKTENKFKKTEIGDIPVDWEIGKITEYLVLRHGHQFRNYDFTDYGYPVYLYYLLSSPIVLRQILTKANITAQANFGKSDLDKIIVPIPPISEQKKIAEILSAVDETIEKSNEIIEKTKELKKGLMKELRTIAIPAPALPEQKKIAEILSCVNEEMAKEAKRKENLGVVKAGLMQVLLTGKVRVKNRGG